jgi:hypothetical protein
MELWFLIDGWLAENRHILSEPRHIRIKVSTIQGIAWIVYKEIIIIVIRQDHVIIMPPITDYYTIKAQDPTFWHKLPAAIDRCIEQFKR